MRKSQVLFLTAIIAAMPMAFAQDPAPAAGQKATAGQEMKSFTQLDKNQDGQLTKAELPSSAMHSQHFASIDTDSSGSLSEAEVQRHLIEDMGMSPDDMTRMNHGDMEGMECMKGMKCMEGMDHGDMKDMDHGDMDMMDDNDN